MSQAYQQICDRLMADGIKSVKGGETWCSSTVKSILQKTFSEDLFDGRRVKNEGLLPKYYVHDCHPDYQPDRLADFLETMKERCRLSQWFFGHYHTNGVIDGRFVVQWERISKIETQD